MPFLEYHLLEKSGKTSTRTSRGYSSSLSIWTRLDEIGILAGKFGIRNPQMRKSVLAAGPCPDLWRVYYAATTHAETYEKVSHARYLGIKLTPDITSRKLGLEFEKWVKHANRFYNSFLETRTVRVLNAIPGWLGRHYRKRTRELLGVADMLECTKTKIAINPGVSPSLNTTLDLTPDGVFGEGSRAAIFESKLSTPNYAEFNYEMALYALAYEKSTGKDVESAIVLHSNYPTRQRLSTLVRFIYDSEVGNISTNLERFVRLVEYSQLARPIQLQSYPSWKSFLVRPKGLPTPSQRGPCPSCRFRSKCYAEGGAS